MFQQLKSGEVMINSPKKLCDPVNKFTLSISTPFGKENNLLCEPGGLNNQPLFLKIPLFLSFVKTLIKNIRWCGEN